MNASTAAAGAPPWLDLALLGRALCRRVRGTEWEVVVRPAAGSRQPVFSQNVSTQSQAITSHIDGRGTGNNPR